MPRQPKYVRFTREEVEDIMRELNAGCLSAKQAAGDPNIYYSRENLTERAERGLKAWSLVYRRTMGETKVS